MKPRSTLMPLDSADLLVAETVGVNCGASWSSYYVPLTREIWGALSANFWTTGQCYCLRNSCILALAWRGSRIWRVFEKPQINIERTLSPTAADMGHLNDSTVRFVDNRRYKPGTENNIRSVAMKIGAPTETAEGEARVALTPESAERLQKLGYECLVESGAGAAASITDAAYEAAGVKVLGSASELWSEVDVIVKVREHSLAEV